MAEPHLFFSNKLEVLFEAMAPLLYQPSLGKKIVVVPSRAMKQWLMERFVQTPAYRTAFGFHVMQLKEALFWIKEKSFSEAFLMPPLSQLGWMVQREVDALLDKEQGNPEFDPLFQLCSGNRKKKSAHLSIKLAKLFAEYGENAPFEMQKAEGEDFQLKIWRKIFPSRQDLKSAPIHLPVELYLFGISYLTVAEQELLNRFASQIPIHYFVLSPSRLFWGDLLTKKERVRWLKQTKGKGEEFLAEDNEFLSQNGRLGRLWMKRLEALGSAPQEEYWVGKGAEAYEAYRELAVEGVYSGEEPWSLLSALQADLVLLRDPKAFPIDFPKEERSIEVHEAPSLLREVEALYHTLLDALGSSPELKPREMVVLVSDLALYEPLIRMVFGSNESKLQFQIVEGSKRKTPLLSAFTKILDLVQSRFERERVLSLFNDPLFYKAHRLTPEDLLHFTRFAKEEGVHFGIDPAHKKSYFHAQGFHAPHLGEEERGSWRGAFSRLIAKCGMDKELSFANLEALGRCSELFESLLEELSPLLNEEPLAISAWGEKLKGLLDHFLDGDAAEEEAGHLLKVFNSLLRAGKEPYPFSTLYIHLKEELERSVFSHEERPLQAVRFCSMLPMRAIPAEVVALLGISQGRVPKQASISSLDRFHHFAKGVEKPARQDFDRYLFLESMLSARKRWLLFYSKGPECKGPSLLIEELFHYLDSGYAIGGEKPSRALLVSHPLHGFDRSYFTGTGRLKNYSESDYRAALCHYGEKAPEKTPLELPALCELGEEELSKLPDEVSVQELSRLLSHPIRAYQKSALGIDIEEEKGGYSTLNDFEEEDYLFHTMRKEALRSSVDEALEKASLPSRPFRGAVEKRMRQKLNELKGKLSEAGSCFEVEFVPGLEAPEKAGDALIRVPAPKIDCKGKKISITGTLFPLSKKGLISLKGASSEERLKRLVESWMLHYLPEGLLDKKILYLENGMVENAHAPLWEELFAFYLSAKSGPIFLSPKWVEALLDEDPVKLRAEQEKSLQDQYLEKADRNLLWQLRNRSLPNPKALIKALKGTIEPWIKREEP